MAIYEKVRDLPICIESCHLGGRSRLVSESFERHTTVVRLRGDGEEGLGEDVAYDSGDQLAFQSAGDLSAIRGRFTLDSFSDRLEEIDLFPKKPSMPAYRDYRRWALESAALDLGLRQAGETLHARMDMPLRPLRFVVSPGLGFPSSTLPLRALLDRVAGLQFKLDATREWEGKFLQELVQTRAVATVDFKGAYHGTPVDGAPDPDLHARVAEAFPDACLEDPAWTDATAEILAPHLERVSWDAPIHSIEDIESLPHPPRILNMKPSRFGSVRRLFDAYDYCREKKIRMYGGGQFELGPGRGQIQYLAAMFHPHGDNDVAPNVYNRDEPGSKLPAGPLALDPEGLGFRLRPEEIDS